MLSDSTVIADTIYYHWVSGDPVATYLVTITFQGRFRHNKKYWHHLSNPNDSIPLRLYYTTGEDVVNANEQGAADNEFLFNQIRGIPISENRFCNTEQFLPWEVWRTRP